MSATISPLPSFFLDNGFKSGASMWFSLDSNSPWGPSVISAYSSPANPLPISSGSLTSSFFSVDKESDLDWQNQSALKKAVAKPKPIKTPIMPETLTKKSPVDDFVQLSPNQRWSAQPIGFPKAQNQPFLEKKSMPVITNKSQQIPQVQSSAPQPIEINSVSTTQKALDGEEDSTSQSLYKTELCRSFEETGSCRYGLKCQFAHGRAELRHVNRHPKYKTEVCKTFHTIGTCPYGKRCRFIHIEQGLCQQQTPNSSPAPSKPIAEQSIVPAQLIEPACNAWSDPTPVNVSPIVGKDLETISLPSPPLIEKTLPVMKTSNDMNNRRSRLVIFQQICS